MTGGVGLWGFWLACALVQVSSPDVSARPEWPIAAAVFHSSLLTARVSGLHLCLQLVWRAICLFVCFCFVFACVCCLCSVACCVVCFALVCFVVLVFLFVLWG